jgi:hypothetical protein
MGITNVQVKKKKKKFLIPRQIYFHMDVFIVHTTNFKWTLHDVVNTYKLQEFFP